MLVTKPLALNNVLWLEGPVRVAFAVAAVLSGAGLYLAVPMFTGRPWMFASAVLSLFFFEVLYFEAGLRQLLGRLGEAGSRDKAIRSAGWIHGVDRSDEPGDRVERSRPDEIVFSEGQAFWLRIRAVLYREIALVILMGGHQLLNLVLKWTIPANLSGALTFVVDIVFAGFSVVYLYLVFEMVAVFVPPIKRRLYIENSKSEAYLKVQHHEGQ
jgi:hypothetical protein